MRFDSIQGRLSFLFFAFAILVLVSVGVTLWGITTQRQDALIINLAGRQRMLVQQMTRQAIEIEHGADEDVRVELQKAINTFEQTLNAFQEGGSTLYLTDNSVALPASNDPTIRTQLSQLAHEWRPFRENLQLVLQSEPGHQDFQNAILNIEQNAAALVQQADRVVRQYEQVAENKVSRIIWIQSSFLICALFLLGLGSRMMKKSILDPLSVLIGVTERIGESKLETPVNVPGPTEMRALGQAFENTREQLLISRQEILDWTETLEERVRQRTLELEAVHMVSREISSHLDIQSVLGSVTEKSRQLLSADVAFLCLMDDQKNLLNLQSTSGSPQAVAACETPANTIWTSQVIASEQALRCEADGCHGFCQIVAKHYRNSHLAAPLSIGNRIIGALCVASQQPDFFTDEATCLLTRLANVASIALENARLYSQLERSAALEERHRIAADMHDGLAQTLSFLTFTTDRVREQLEAGDTPLAKQTLASVQQGVDRATVDIRRAIASLHDEFPTQYTLQEQLSSLIQELGNVNKHVVWENKTNIPLVLAHQKAEQVLRVVREALVNAQKHSQATQILVNLERPNDHALVSVEDNGIGFDPQSVQNQGNRPHFGLKIMQARAVRLEGQLEIHSHLGKGTRVVLTWPIEEDE